MATNEETIKWSYIIEIGSESAAIISSKCNAIYVFTIPGNS